MSLKVLCVVFSIIQNSCSDVIPSSIVKSTLSQKGYDPGWYMQWKNRSQPIWDVVVPSNQATQQPPSELPIRVDDRPTTQAPFPTSEQLTAEELPARVDDRPLPPFYGSERPPVEPGWGTHLPPTGGGWDSQNPPINRPDWNDHENCPRDVIHDRYGGHGYFFSWEDRRSHNLRMTWTQAVNFCRKRCLEPVSIETVHEHDFLARHIASGRIHAVWSSGRKCDFSGCEKESHLHPVDVYGWFWEGSRVQLPPVTDRFDSRWSPTGAKGRPQPDDLSGVNGREHESCLAILNNAYNDGVSWHDELCSLRLPFICEESAKYQTEYPTDPTKFYNS